MQLSVLLLKDKRLLRERSAAFPPLQRSQCQGHPLGRLVK
jgi:hypothetical protein